MIAQGPCAFSKHSRQAVKLESCSTATTKQASFKEVADSRANQWN